MQYKKVIKRITKPLLILGVKAFMSVQKYFTHIVEVNNKHLSPSIYVMWHHDQFCLYGIPNKSHLHIQISKSYDGDIITKAVEMLGFKTVRGSASKKGAVESTMRMLELLKQEECVAIMVDGPNGPLHKVKNGAVKLAQLTGAPIVPVVWYSEQSNFIKLPSWDKMTCPVGDAKIINLYGDPIYVEKELSDEQFEEYKAKIKSVLEKLTEQAPQEFQDAKQKKLW